MTAALRRGRALLYNILSTRQSLLRSPASIECSDAGISLHRGTIDRQLTQAQPLLGLLGHDFRSCASVHYAGLGEQAEMHSSDREELQIRRASSSSASTSYSGTLLPPGARSGRERRHFSSSSSDASPGESSARKLTPAFRRRQRRIAASKGRTGLSREGALISTSSHGSMADRDDPQPPDALETAASAEQPVTRHRTRLRERAGKVPEEARKSKKTQKLEAMAAEMLRENEAIDGPQASTSAEPSPAKHLQLPPYHELDKRAAAFLEGTGERLPLEKAERDRIIGHTTSFAKSAKMRDAALALYVNAQLFDKAAKAFEGWILRGIDERLRDALMSAEPGEAESALFNLFARFVLANFSEQIKKYSQAIQMLDLRKPHLWYPMARALKRRLIYHMGPTNSGKTYHALQAMRAAASGVYCGPLRLLAMEVYDELNATGTHCNLITGQERSILPTAEHTACTIEMTNLQKRVDLAVIDEIQQIGDDQRGWAWTRALQGIPANEIHLCGDPSALPLVRKLAEQMNEPLEVNEYHRFTPLVVEAGGLQRGYLDVQPGDCVVAFSRKDIYDIKQLIEAGTGQRVCVVYGALPPEMRRTQARLFNDADSGYDVLVASDAVGMGLNLNIRRIIFHTLSKTEGGGRVPISISQIKQIAGRAGRRSSKFGQGLVTCLNAGDTARLQQALDAPLDSLSTDTAGLFVEFEQLEAFAGAQLESTFDGILTRFAEEAQVDGTYMFCRQDSVIQAAKFLSRVNPLSLQERFWFCMAPANLRSPVSAAALMRIAKMSAAPGTHGHDVPFEEERFWFCMAPANLRSPLSAAALMRFAKRYAARETVSADIPFKEKTPATSEELCELEAVHQVISLWIWLSYRFPEEYFASRDHAEALSERLIGYMSDGLQAMFGPTAAIVSPKARKAACEKLATWTNGAKDASEVAELVGGQDVKVPASALWNAAKAQPGTELEVA